MIQAKCLDKIRDKKGNIIGYKLIDKNKNEVAVKAERLKEVIKSKQVDVINLTLTSDNRLINKKPATSSKPISTPSKSSAEAILAKVRVLGYPITAFDTACGHKCYIASLSGNTEHIFIIPDDVKYIYKPNVALEYSYEKKLYNYITNIEGALKVVGGKNLVLAVSLFTNCKMRSLDLSSFNTSNVTDMREMFENCKAHSIDLSSFNTSKVTSMRRMFDQCKTNSLDLSSFNTSNVTDMQSMFAACTAQSLDLSSFNTSNVTDMRAMFDSCKAQYIDLTSFDTSKVTDMCGMFEKCKAQSLDLKHFDTSKVTDMRSMFEDCEAHSLDLTSFDTSNTIYMDWVFSSCKAQIKVNDSWLQYKLQSRRR